MVHENVGTAELRSEATRLWAVALVLLASCGSSSSSNSNNNSGALNNCSTFQDASAGSRNITFTFPSYSPACMSITAGQTVTFSGAFGTHPLEPGESPESPGGMSSPNNPITPTTSGSSLSVTFPTAGLYGFYCGVHHASGMAGVIKVN
jgi:plastocyanin